MAAAAILDFRSRKFLFADGIWRAQTHHCTNFVKIGCSVTDILRFFEFSRWPPPQSWIFENVKFYSLLESRVARRIRMSNYVINWSIGCKDIKIFRFFKMAAAPILYIRNSEFLFAAGICGSQTHHCTKFHQNRDFSNFQDGRRRHLGFLKSQNFIGY